MCDVGDDEGDLGKDELKHGFRKHLGLKLSDEEIRVLEKTLDKDDATGSIDAACVERIRLRIRENASPRHVPARVFAVSAVPWAAFTWSTRPSLFM